MNNALLSSYDYCVLIASYAVCFIYVDIVVHVAEEKFECIWKSSLELFGVRLGFALMFIEQMSCTMTAVLLICFIIPRLNIVDSFAARSKSQEKLCSSKQAEEQCLPVSNARKKVHVRNKQSLRLYLQSIKGTLV